MTFKYTKPLLGLTATLLLVGCTASKLISTPVANIDTTPLKISDLTATEKKNWGHKDLVLDTIPGMSVDKAYKELIKKKKGTKVIVAVLDSGMDLKHEDLDGVLWTNKKEKAGNGIDDDNNGYIDDIHGYNFLGDSYNEQLEFARMLRLNIGSTETLAKAKTELEEKYTKAVENKQQYEQILQQVKISDAAIKKLLGKDSYTKEDLASIKTEDETMQQNIVVLTQMLTYEDSIPKLIEELNGGIKHFTDSANYNLNKDFNGRTVVGDNPYDITDLGYGNGNPQNQSEDESHGTHVAGIIAAERNNGKGANGVANNVAIMSIRAVPNGDEYDKDIALGIRYAVDNGAKVINCSFGKSYSPKAEWVYEAIKYAAANDVLIVHAAGNDGHDIDSDKNPNFPTDLINYSGSEIANNVITVGALSPKYGSELLASFSNYGKVNVDVFAPGAKIYSTVPGSKYDTMGGTSMAAPAVAGVAALLLSQYPTLKVAQVKKIIMQSGLTVKSAVILGGDSENSSTLDKVSVSGRIVNAYNALIMAEKVVSGTFKL